jgi:hypothetical protein
VVEIPSFWMTGFILILLEIDWRSLYTLIASLKHDVKRVLFPDPSDKTRFVILVSYQT